MPRKTSLAPVLRGRPGGRWERGTVNAPVRCALHRGLVTEGVVWRYGQGATIEQTVCDECAKALLTPRPEESA